MLAKVFALTALFLATSAPYCQEAPTVAQMKQMLALSLRRGQLDTEGMTPFHLVASFQAFDAEGRAGGKGTLDELWQSPTRYRETLTLPGMKRTTGKDGKERLEEAVGAPPRELVEVDNGTTLWRTGEWVFFGGTSAAIDATLQPFLYKSNVSDRLSYEASPKMDAALDCIGTEPDLPGVSADTRLALTTYCLNKGNHLLRLLAMPDGRTISFNDVEPFEKKYIARSIAVAIGGKLRLKFHVDALEAASDFSSLDAAPPASAQHLNFHRAEVPYLSGEVMPGQLLSSVPLKHVPRRPFTVKLNIDTTGTVTSVEMVNNYNSALDYPLLADIKQWKFRVAYQGDKIVPFTKVMNFRQGTEDNGQ